MDWVKRNLYWVIGGVVAFGLLGFSGYYLYSNLQQEKAIDEELTRQLDEWTNLEKAKPHPDDGSIAAAKQDLTRIKNLVGNFEKCFASFDYPKLTDSLEFKKALETTVDQLRRQAKESDVLIQTNYYFSFEAERLPTRYDPASLQPLGERLTEVVELCQVLFKAKVKSLESLQRVSAGKDDTVQSDLLSSPNQTTNTLAIVTPYQVTFVAFTAQLAGVINGFAQSPQCFLIRSLNITTNASVTGKPPGGPDSPTGETPAVTGQAAPDKPEDYMLRMMRRYGRSYRPGGAGGPGSAYARNPYGGPQTPAGPPTPGAFPTAPVKRGPETILEELPLRAVMQIDVVKVLPPSERGKYKAAPARAKASPDAAGDSATPPAGQETSGTPAN